MTYNKLTLDCTCKCGFSWKGRCKNPPVKCPSCGSRKWNSDTRTFTSLISRAGKEDTKTGFREFCIIDYVDAPAVVTDDVFYVSKEDTDKYLTSQRYPPGSAVIWIGNFEIGEDNLLKIDTLKLVYCHTSTFLSYNSQCNCIYNIASFYNKKKAQKRYEEEKLLKEIREEQRKQKAIQEARERLNAAKERKAQEEEAERIINDAATPTDEAVNAIKFLRR